jgi:hypothetical protein
MQFYTLATIAVLATSVLAWPSSSSSAAPSSSSSNPTDTCYTITSINAPPCPMPTPCIKPDCILVSTITQSCGCASIYTTDICLSTCPLGCGVTYTTVYDPCPISFSSPASSPTSSTSPSSPTSSSAPTTSVPYSNSTITATSITTLTTCPASCTCSGQTTTWSGTSGPFTCTKVPSCSVVLPGGGTTTVTGVTVVKTGPTPTTSASVTGASNVQTSEGKKKIEAGGLLAGLLGLLAFL